VIALYVNKSTCRYYQPDWPYKDKINSANLVDIIIDAGLKYDIEVDYDSADKIGNSRHLYRCYIR